MGNRALGNLILKGNTTKEIRKKFPDFPLNPTVDDLCNFGYKKSTANNYLYKLRNNDKQTAEQDLISDKAFIKSDNVDVNNLLIDTSSIGNFETLKLIEKAEHVTIINSTIEEMDRKKKIYKNSQTSEKILASNIRVLSNKILQDTEKYRMSIFSGFNNENYPDNVLLQYLMILPKQIRPTLLTADKILGAKAQMWSLPFILFDIAERNNIK